MKIVVCIRYGTYLCSQLGFNPLDNTIRQESLVDKINTCDENALEEALKIKDRLGGKCTVSVITAGGPKAEEALRYCLALGADSAFHVCDPDLDNSDALITASALFDAIRQMQFDLILCGKKGEDTCRGQVGMYLAELLGLPAVSSVVALDVKDGRGKALVHKSLGKGDRVVLACPLPALFTVEKGINSPRYPAVTSRLRAHGEHIARIEPKTPDTAGEADWNFLPELTKISLPRKRPRKTVKLNSNLSPAERLKALMAGGGAKKKKDDDFIEEDNPEEAAGKLVSYLRETGFLVESGDR